MAVFCGHCKRRHATPYDVYVCSLGAHRRKMAPARVVAEPPAAPSLMTPVTMIKSMRDGRYAVRPDANTHFTFIRISRPKVGKKKGCLVIQTQHSDWYKDCIVFYPSGRVFVADKRVDASLLLLVVDPITAALAYSKEMHVCCRCGRDLTDGRSQYYGVGPECEKYLPELINVVNETHGVYVPGATRHD